MNKKIKSIIMATALSLVSLNVFSLDYKCDQIIKKQAYTACYNFSLKATLFVKFNMKKSDLLKKGFERKSVRFYEETIIPKKHRATLADWRSSGYDRSHLASNDDMNHSRKLQKETFSLACNSHHYPSVNRNAILSIEKLMRRLTRYNDESIVYSGNIFDRINPKRVGPGRVAVPTKYYRVIHFPKTNKTVAFLVENTKGKKSTKASNYKVDVKTLEKLVGYRFDFKRG